jgi:hypothetical protein
LAHVEKRGFCAIFLSSVIPVRHDGRRPVHFPNNRKLGGDQAEADQPYVHTALRSLPDIDRLRMREIRGTQGLADELADGLADEIRACEPTGVQPIESCASFQVNSNFEGPGLSAG